MYFILPAGAVITLALLLVFFVASTLQPGGASAGRLDFLGDRAGLMLVLFALASLLLGLYLRNIIPVKWFVPLSILLILFDLWSVNETSNKGHVEDRFADIPFADQLKAAPGTFRVAADQQLLPGHFGIATQLEEIGGISPLRLTRYDTLLKLPPDIVLPLLNVNYAIRANTGLDAEVVERDGDLQLLRLNNAQPRAWMVGSAVAEQNDGRAGDRAANGFETERYPGGVGIAKA